MAENVLEITDDNFEDTVLNSDTPIVVDFWAEWCGPCKMIAPTLEQLADEYVGTFKVGKYLNNLLTSMSAHSRWVS
jgi:thioredoxin 1